MIDSKVVEALRSKRGTVEVLVDDKWFEIDSFGIIEESDWNFCVWLDDYDKINLTPIGRVLDVRVLEEKRYCS